MDSNAISAAGPLGAVPQANQMPGGPAGMPRSMFPAQTPVGMAYVPWQNMNKVYDPERGLATGTIFPDLDYPWLGSKAFAVPERGVNP